VPSAEPKDDDHYCDVIDEVAEGYVLMCTCGWRSTPAPTAAAVGEEWDHHRAE
jgi:hypothetical protein